MKVNPQGRGLEKIRELIPWQLVAEDTDSGYTYLRTLSDVRGDRIGLVGFCWGGEMTFASATRVRGLRAAVVFYGRSPDKAALARIRCPVFGFYAENDARVNDTLDQTAEAMRAAGKTFDPVTYQGGGHGFMRQGEAPDAREGNKKAREGAWKRWKELLAKAGA